MKYPANIIEEEIFRLDDEFKITRFEMIEARVYIKKCKEEINTHSELLLLYTL
jgi:hypothetical protein